MERDRKLCQEDSDRSDQKQAPDSNIQMSEKSLPGICKEPGICLIGFHIYLPFRSAMCDGQQRIRLWILKSAYSCLPSGLPAALRHKQPKGQSFESRDLWQQFIQSQAIPAVQSITELLPACGIGEQLLHHHKGNYKVYDIDDDRSSTQKSRGSAAAREAKIAAF
jgi:hypothetical protein